MTIHVNRTTEKMIGASCFDQLFLAPEPVGNLLCKTANVTYDHYPMDQNLEIGAKCRIICGDALAIPEFVYCGETGWDVNSTDM